MTVAAPGAGGEPPEAPRRRGGIGPFSARQLVTVLGVVVAAAVGLFVLTRPLGPGSGGAAGATALPGSTPFLVGPATTGLRPGDLAPELSWRAPDGSTATLTDLDGRPVRLADLRGRLVWINFWATWCPPCQAETPVLRDMAERYASRGLVVLAIAVQETSVDNVRDYAQRYELPYPIAFDASADAFGLYKVFALPTQFFVGPDGVIREVVNGPLTDDTASQRIEAYLP